MALVNQIILALGWKNAVVQTEVCFAVLCFVVVFFCFFSFTPADLSSAVLFLVN